MNSHKIIKSYFDGLAKIFDGYFGEPASEKLPFQKDTYEWLNYFYQSKIFRHVHLEFYKTEKLCVLHINTFPNPYVDLPIMGFDLIAIGEKITGLFFDFTPTITESSVLNNCLNGLYRNYTSEARELPGWANFFSENFYCVTPKTEEITKMLSEISTYISFYLEMGKNKLQEYNRSIEKQNNYCLGQQKNDKTFKALSVEIGKDNADIFMKEYLFPVIEKE